MAYQILGPPGKKKVVFRCLGCAVELTSPLEEAGQRFGCPTCGLEFVTPGDVELRQQQQARADAARAKRDAAEALASAAPAVVPSSPVPRPTVAHSPTLAYSAPGVPASVGIPDYADILHGNQMLRTFAFVVSIIGYVAIGIAALGLLAFLIGLMERGGALLGAPGLVFFFGGVSYGVACLVIAAMLRMYGALAVAVRDIARNSYTRQ